MGEFPTAKSCWRWGRRQDDGEELRRREEEIEDGLSDDMRKSDFHTWLFYPYAKI
ncbi:hypothetical protein OsJ_07194 [Oryza sativa Japonica Group]|uniref:Uncharacterized protein n=1 Tax=Oryza sativa subsp. japonica TaxID=39947 RepID=B9F0N1_ORYSJ|nr:hypothetical protein OsJ_07194 [Oryza sativa Japonica Group]